MGSSDDLHGFVRDALARGVPREDVSAALTTAGWSRAQVRDALAAFATIDFPLPVPRPRASLGAREAFRYLLLFTTLYLVCYHLGSLVFQFIEHTLPDAAEARPASYRRDAVRFSIASMVVALPVFLFMARLVARAVEADPGLRRSSVRRGLTYLTLFVAACLLIGDVTTLVYRALGGELTLRFVLKALTVAAIAGTAFWYYLGELRLDEQEGRA